METIQQNECEKTVHPHTVTILVNTHPVELQGPRVTGLEIKQAAVDQGVNIELTFVLTEEHPSGSRIIGDNDVVTITPRSIFLAIPPDDNS